MTTFSLRNVSTVRSPPSQIGFHRGLPDQAHLVRRPYHAIIANTKASPNAATSLSRCSNTKNYNSLPCTSAKLEQPEVEESAYLAIKASTNTNQNSILLRALFEVSFLIESLLISSFSMLSFSLLSLTLRSLRCLERHSHCTRCHCCDSEFCLHICYLKSIIISKGSLR